ncbi:hypothetical protein M0804_013651 [Polistes exclamans]|nr:hypothetical protein M0804_013651 [Polistes exclamans]
MDLDKEKSTENLSDKKLSATISHNIGNISIDNKQSERKYICNYAGCNLAYFKQSRLDRHIRLHTGERPYKCNYPECTKAYTNSSHLKRHIETHNCTKTKLQCSKCFLMLSNRHNLKRHYARVHDNVLTCNECNEEFTKKHQLTQHIAMHNNVIPYKCNQCDKILISIKNLKRHEKLHKKGKKSYPCSQCTEVFDKWTLLFKHKQIQHINGKYYSVIESSQRPCLVEKTSSRIATKVKQRWAWLVLGWVTTSEHYFKCDQCKKVFSNENYLNRHLKIHNKSRCFIPCPYKDCEKSYLSKSNLTNHINYYHLNKKFICDICKTGLSAKSKLIQHIQTHESNNKFKKKQITKQRKIRKDVGIPRKSMVTVLSGLRFDQKRDAELLKRKTDIELKTTQDLCINDKNKDV